MRPAPLPTPTELGFPPKFLSWYDDQLEAIDRTVLATSRFIALAMPTGCLAGDTEIHLNRSSNGYRTTLAEEYYRQTRHTSRRRPGIVARTRSYKADTGTIALHAIQAVVEHPPASTWIVGLANGRHLRGTADHPILTSRDFVPLSELRRGDEVLCDTLLATRSKGPHKQHYRRVQGLVFHPFANRTRSFTRKGGRVGEGKRLYCCWNHRLVVEAHLNGLTLDDLIDICRYDELRASALVYLDPEEFHVHHRDKNPKNNAVDNLEILSPSAHRALHGIAAYGNFSQGVPVSVPVSTRPTCSGVVEKVYDIVCVDPYRNFVANGAVVHNSGKSLTGTAAALLHPSVKRALYLTSTKGLQDQAARDFTSVGMVDLRGQRNYPCIAVEPGASLSRYRHNRTTVSCDEGPCHSGVWCPRAPDRKTPYLRPECPYYERVFDARGASLVLTNYAMYLSSQEYAEGLGTLDLLILDEAHDADKALESFLTVEIDTDDCRYLNSKFPKGATLQDWKNWASHFRGPLAAKLEGLNLMPPADAEGVRERRRLKTILSKLERLSEIEPLKWALDEDGLTATFCPIRVAGYAEAYLFRGIPHVVLMSATLTHKSLTDLGIARTQYSFWEAPSRIPVTHRPVISLETTPAVRVNHRMDDEGKFFWMRRIDRIIDTRHRLGWKGIIHTVSYERMRDLHHRSEFKHLMVIYDPKGSVHGDLVFRALPDAIAHFKSAVAPYVLVSPSIVTGYDFPDDDCRYQIIAKVPIPDMRGPIMKARGEIDKEYAGHLAMQKLVQACGRPVRGPKDWAETFIVDDVFADYFYKYNRKHAPRWFQEAVERVDYLPDPLVVVA